MWGKCKQCGNQVGIFNLTEGLCEKCLSGEGSDHASNNNDRNHYIARLLSELSSTNDFCLQSEIIKKLGKTKSTNIVKPIINCLNKGGSGLAYEFDELKQIATDILSDIAMQGNDIEELIKGLRVQNPDVRHCISKALRGANVVPKYDDDKAYYYIALDRWDNVSKLGAAAQSALVYSLKYSNESIAREKIIKALSSTGWEPDDPESKLAQYVTNGEWEKVQKMGAIAINPCFALLQEEDRKNEDKVIKTLQALAMKASTAEKDRNTIIRGLINELADEAMSVSHYAIQALIALGEPSVPLLITAYNDVLSNIENPDKYPVYYSGGIRGALVKIGPIAIPYIERDIIGTEFGLLERDEIIKDIRKG